MSKLTDLLYQLTGVAFGLHNQLGCDHLEEVYQRMLLARLEKAGYKVTNKPVIPLHDDYGKVARNYIPDLRVCKDGLQVLLELKADPKGIQESDKRQARSYLAVSPEDQAVLLLNFGTPRLGKAREYQHYRPQPIPEEIL